jgi:predicted transcriptional regulator
MKNEKNIKIPNRKIRYTVRFNEEENNLVLSKSNLCGLEPSAFIRAIAIKKEVKANLSEEEKNMYRQLIGISNNINQLQKAVNIHGPLVLLGTIVNTLKELNNLINKFNR